MADDRDKAQQTEEPTAKRLQQAQEHGDVVKSTEVTTFIMLLGGTLAVAIFGASTTAGMMKNMQLFIEQPDQMSVDPGGLMILARHTLIMLAGIMTPVLALMIASAIGGHVMQARPSLNFEKIAPDFSKSRGATIWTKFSRVSNCAASWALGRSRSTQWRSKG